MKPLEHPVSGVFTPQLFSNTLFNLVQFIKTFSNYYQMNLYIHHCGKLKNKFQVSYIQPQLR